MFRALAQGRRRRAGALEVTAADLGRRDEPPRVAFAVGRRVGGAVVRNRVRRRLRAATREHRALLRPGCAYLVRAGASASSATYAELSDALCTALRAHGDGPS
jgi:ribonuclease P protein component